MVSEEIYELCLPVLQKTDLDEEERAEQLEELLRDKASLTGSALENAVLDVLWRHRNQGQPEASPPPSRHTIIRRSSPAPWQMARSSTPLSSPSQTGTSPAGASSIHLARAGLQRGSARSSTVSPFSSPRPSPRLAFAQPIPHSPNLNAYEFSDQGPPPDFYGDLGSESNVDWLVSDDATSVASTGGLSASAPEFVPDMSPLDILKSVLGDKKSNEEIEAALEANSYDLGATIAALSQQDSRKEEKKTKEGQIVVGKSTLMEPRPATPSSQRSPVVCKYWLSTGQCLRSDCRFSHDLSSHICKYVSSLTAVFRSNCMKVLDDGKLLSRRELSILTRSRIVNPEHESE